MKRRKQFKNTPSVKANQRSHRGESFHPWRNQRCRTKKISFSSVDEAQLYARRSHKELEAYRCQYCGGLHLGTPMEFNFENGALAFLRVGGYDRDLYDIYQCPETRPCGGKWHYRLKLVV